MRPVMGVSISTRNVSFHDRLNIREIMPIVLMNVLSNTLTFRHTVLPIRVVSLDNLDVISPARRKTKLLCSIFSLLCNQLFRLYLTCFVLCVHMSALPVFMVSKNPISCLVKAPNSITLILHVKECMAQVKRPPLQPALTELFNQRENLLDVTCEEQRINVEEKHCLPHTFPESKGP